MSFAKKREWPQCPELSEEIQRRSLALKQSGKHRDPDLAKSPLLWPVVGANLCFSCDYSLSWGLARAPGSAEVGSHMAKSRAGMPFWTAAALVEQKLLGMRASVYLLLLAGTHIYICLMKPAVWGEKCLALFVPCRLAECPVVDMWNQNRLNLSALETWASRTRRPRTGGSQ